MHGEPSRPTEPAPGAEAEPAGNETRRRVDPLLDALFDRYWRVRVDGERYLPADGPALVIGNHSGALPFDGAVVARAVERATGRRVRPLVAPFACRMEPFRRLLDAFEAVPASYEAADRLLADGEMVLLFPEGVPGTARLFHERYRLRPFATSTARLSMDRRVPVVPFSLVGAEESAPMIGRSRRLGRAVGAPYLPVTLPFPLLGPLAAVPLPTRWTLRFGPRVHLYRERRFAGGRDFEAMSERLRRTVAAQLAVDLDRRSSILFG